jgi:formylmethanofuran dehydrogenase subunit E
MDLPQTGKRMLAIVETDGCGADGIAVATGCWLGRRTLRVEDYGKLAATFADRTTERAVRIRPHLESRRLGQIYGTGQPSAWHAMLHAYQVAPAGELLQWQLVRLTTPLGQLVSRPGRRAACDRCGEEVINEREIEEDGGRLCRACAGPAYYEPTGPVG